MQLVPDCFWQVPQAQGRLSCCSCEPRNGCAGDMKSTSSAPGRRVVWHPAFCITFCWLFRHKTKLRQSQSMLTRFDSIISIFGEGKTRKRLWIISKNYLQRRAACILLLMKWGLTIRKYINNIVTNKYINNIVTIEYIHNIVTIKYINNILTMDFINTGLRA